MKKLKLILILITFLILINCRQDEEVEGLAYDPPGSTITTNKEISFQH